MVKVGLVVRKALEEEIRRRVLLKIEEKAKELGEKLQNISDEEIARLIREDREGGSLIRLRRELHHQPN